MCVTSDSTSKDLMLILAIAALRMALTRRGVYVSIYLCARSSLQIGDASGHNYLPHLNIGF